ncbi:MAG: hypothetical protein BWK79_02905 [Beggiatoa sp. IS2]|nr:MAG: hypothetical protein BWK79_02905 [Beggiatoa sp. IS2]
MQRLVLLTLLFSIQLVGCQKLTAVKEVFFPTTTQESREETVATQLNESRRLEVQALLHQKYIDPLTKYVEIYQNDKSRFDHVQTVRIERDKRCLQIAKRYAVMEKTAINLAQLREGYNYSCPRVVSDFATRVATLVKVETPPEEPPKKRVVTDATVKKLFRQKHIDPLTQYLEKYQNDSTKTEQILVVKEERDKRCAEVEKEYTSKEKNQSNLTRLTNRYHYSCPQIVKEFAAKLTPLPTEISSSSAVSLSTLPDEDSHKIDSKETLEACETALKQQDYAIAFAQCEPLAEQGNASIQYKLGLMYEEGKGVEKDATIALKWLRQAAEQNFSKAQLLIGRKYYTGEGVSKDLATATQWYRRAAEQGDPEAQYVLGVMYELGQGVPQDFVLAYQFFLLSAAQGHPAATASRGEMDTKLSPGQVAEGQRLAREWSNKYTLK